ncbi:lachrymatory-factor synthase-like [Actinidia eriantha]|uniref:lachrymatory-factor synthase-like n=1 Tax=Actinidia eriantha TaxID=165200 RepID=UPI00258CA375|nr:lachrymatory-factor synthase-like [Actinidia eriantha]
MAEETQPKWEGKATVKLIGSTPDQVWPLLEDFCSLNKYLPTIDTCHQVEGVYGQPGLIRYCASTITSSSRGTGEKAIKWCHEKLLAMDPIERCLTYEVLDNNMGFNSYLSTMKVLPIDGDDEHGCQIEWSFVCDPIGGFRFDDLLTYIDSSARSMVEKIGKALQSPAG